MNKDSASLINQITFKSGIIPLALTVYHWQQHLQYLY